MTEQEIRTLTCSIQEAYREMTGITAPPTIAEFLSMRSAAMEELKQGVHVERLSAIYQQVTVPEKTSINAAGSDPIEKVAPSQKILSAKKEELKSPQADLLQQEAESKQVKTDLQERTQRPTGSKVIELNKVKPPAKEEAEISPEEDSLSEFEILKRAGNPWN